MTVPSAMFLPGVPAAHVLQRLNQAGGSEVSSGKLMSPESSAALAVNAFGWFIERPDVLPPFPTLPAPGWEPRRVDVEFCARFPWSGGRHPWLDAVVEASDAVIGVESKRFEPFRDRKTATLSAAYDRPVWHDAMGPYERLRDQLRSGQTRFEHLDAVQLVKHAFGLVTEGRRQGKSPYLVYLFAEPAERRGKPIGAAALGRHRNEIADFAAAVAGAEVRFSACSYREWLDSWPADDPALVRHRDALITSFRP